jgi:hypothetical protein
MNHQSQNSLNNPQMELALQRIVEAQAQLSQVLTQNLISSNNNELPLGVQQLLDAPTRIVQMVSRTMTNNNDNISPSEPRKDNLEEDGMMINQACKLCGDIGHISKDCQEQCHSCGRDHRNEECPISKVMCLLCEGTNHVLTQCHLYSMVDEVNQQVKQRYINHSRKLVVNSSLKLENILSPRGETA